MMLRGSPGSMPSGRSLVSLGTHIKGCARRQKHSEAERPGAGATNRSLRRRLVRAARECACVKPNSFRSLAQIETANQARRKAKERKLKMDMSRYASSGFIKVDDLADGPEQKVITAIGEGKYDKPVATFDDGSKLSLNGTNVGTLIRAFGKNDQGLDRQAD